MESNFELHEIKGHIAIPYNVKFLGQSENIYFENKLKEIIQTELKDKKLDYESFQVIDHEYFETAVVSLDKQIAYRITYKARRRNDDDDLRESIEYMIENLTENCK